MFRGLQILSYLILSTVRGPVHINIIILQGEKAQRNLVTFIVCKEVFMGDLNLRWALNLDAMPKCTRRKKMPK